MADFIDSTLLAAARWVRPHLDGIAMAFVACLLVLYGEDINRWVAREIRSHNILIRIAIFIAVCAIGYGALSVAATSVISEMLHRMDRRLLGPLILLAFIAIGALAQQKRQI